MLIDFINFNCIQNNCNRIKLCKVWKTELIDVPVDEYACRRVTVTNESEHDWSATEVWVICLAAPSGLAGMQRVVHVVVCTHTQPYMGNVCVCHTPPCMVRLLVEEGGGDYKGGDSNHLWLTLFSCLSLPCLNWRGLPFVRLPTIIYRHSSLSYRTAPVLVFAVLSKDKSRRSSANHCYGHLRKTDEE